jgi:hypothetical protein
MILGVWVLTFRISASPNNRIFIPFVNPLATKTYYPCRILIVGCCNAKICPLYFANVHEFTNRLKVLSGMKPMRNIYRAGLLLAVILVLAACGTVATPRYEADRIIGEAQAEATHIIETALAQGGEVEAVTVEPTEAATEEITEIATEEVTEEIAEVTEEATEIATEEATEAVAETATEEATVEVTDEADEATEEATEEHDDHATTGETSEAEAEIEAAVDAADAAAGEITFLSTGCVACHMTTDMVMIGPGLAGVFERAGDHADHRPADQGPHEYVFTSIRNSQAFIVEGFTPNLMPVYSEAQLSDEDIYNIMAYLRQFSDLPE